MKKNPLKSNAVQSLIASLVCILLGLFIGYLALLIINPAGAGKAIGDIVKNFLTYNKPASQLKYFGNTLVKTAPLLMCALSVLFAYNLYNADLDIFLLIKKSSEQVHSLHLINPQMAPSLILPEYPDNPSCTFRKYQHGYFHIFLLLL